MGNMKRALWGIMLILGMGLGGQGFAQDAEIKALRSELESLKSELQKLKAEPRQSLKCEDGKSVQGGVNRWSPWSSCPAGSVATGLARVDLQGSHDTPTNHVNDFVCGEQGCRAWCIGNPCTVIARCCR